MIHPKGLRSSCKDSVADGDTQHDDDANDVGDWGATIRRWQTALATKKMMMTMVEVS